MNELVEVRNHQVVVTSRQVAERFGKNHRDVLESIANITKAENSALTFFHKSTYQVPGNFKKYPEYIMNKDGFSLLAMGFTGQKALQWKIKYIEAFNRMEEALKHPEKELPAGRFSRYCKYLRGGPVMTAADLQWLCGIPLATVHVSIKKHHIPAVVISGRLLDIYKQENHISRNSSSSVLIMPREAVIEFMQKTNRYTKDMAEKIAQYFQGPPTEEPPEEAFLLQRLQLLRNTIPYLLRKEDRDRAARYIVDRLMEMDLFSPSDFPGQDIYDLDLNTPVGWNVLALINNANHLLKQGKVVTRQTLKSYEEKLMEFARS